MKSHYSFLIVLMLTASCLAMGCASANTPKPAKPDHLAEHAQRSKEMISTFDQKRDAAQYHAATARWQQADMPGCRELIVKLLDRNPHHRNGRLLRAEMLLLEDNPEAALEDLQKLVAEDPKDAEAEHLLALVFEATGQMDLALGHFKNAAEQAPTNEVIVASYQTALENKTLDEGVTIVSRSSKAPVAK